MKKNKNGFTLTELLVVIAIVTIIALITIPAFQRAYINANEASAISAMRVLIQGENNKFLSTGSFVSIGRLAKENFIDQRFGNSDENSMEAETSIYKYKITLFTMPTGEKNYILSALPTRTNIITQSGTKRFGANKDGAILYDKANLGTHFETLSDLSGLMPVGD